MRRKSTSTSATPARSRRWNAFVIFVILIGLVQGMLPTQVAMAAGGAYTIKFYAADPSISHAPYLPTYAKKMPAQQTCSTPSGGTGRAADPLTDAVAYKPGAAVQNSNLDAVTSLAPKDMALGQIVPFEVEIAVKGSTAPENGTISFTLGWDTRNNSTNFGYDPTYMVYCAFVDTGDAGTVDPGNNAKVNSWTSTLANPGTSTEQIRGTFTVSGLNDNDNVIVEIWVVLKSTIPANPSGNVQAQVIGAATTPQNDTIASGAQNLPLLQLGTFYSAIADLSVSKSDSPDPVVVGQQLTYSIVVTNNSATVVANGVVVTDTLDPNTTFASASGASCSLVSGKVVCNVGALSPLQVATITILTTVNLNAPTAGTTQTGTCTVGAAGVDLCNTVLITAITADSNAANNTDSEPTNATASPALLLTKTASPLTYSAVGQVINYSYDLKNTGNVPLNPTFAVSDNKATVTCPQPASLAVNATLTCTASYNITQTDLNNGTVTNLATATAKFGSSTVTSNQAQATVTATAHPSLLLVKSATPTSYSAIGNVIAYNYLVTNNGNVALAGTLSIVDNKVSVTCTPSSVTLAPGQSSTCTASHSITQADLDAGSITNKATASIGSTSSNQDQATVNAVPSPALSLKKTAGPATYDHVNASISYNYELKNIGNVTLFSPFDVVDNKTSATCPATPTSLAPGGTIVCTATYSIVQADLDFGSVTNKATGSAKFGSSTVLSNEDTAKVNAVQNPSILLDKNAKPALYSAVNQDVTYEYTISNNGNVTLIGPFSVTDDKLGSVACPATPTSLSPGDSVICSVTYKITQADLDAGSITNKATASNGTITSNQDQATVNAVPTPSLHLLKSSPTPNYDAAGDTLSYSYLVTNDGNVTLSGPFTVSDDKTTVTCPAVPSSLAPNQSITCNATYQIKQEDLDAGSVKNTATATNGTVTSNESSVMIGAIQIALLQLDKSADKTTYETLNEVIQYTYVLTNGGNVTLKAPLHRG